MGIYWVGSLLGVYYDRQSTQILTYEYSSSIVSQSLPFPIPEVLINSSGDFQWALSFLLLKRKPQAQMALLVLKTITANLGLMPELTAVSTSRRNIIFINFLINANELIRHVGPFNPPPPPQPRAQSGQPQSMPVRSTALRKEKTGVHSSLLSPPSNPSPPCSAGRSPAVPSTVSCVTTISSS